jgi:hypothetical protein
VGSPTPQVAVDRFLGVPQLDTFAGGQFLRLCKGHFHSSMGIGLEDEYFLLRLNNFVSVPNGANV